MVKKLTQEIAEQKSIEIGAILVGKYINNNTKTEFKCPQCKDIFLRKPTAVWSQKLILCKQCGLKQRSKKKMLTQSLANQKILEVGAIQVGEYNGENIKIEFQCPKCNIIFLRIPLTVWRGHILCKKCARQKQAQNISMASKEESLGFLHPEIAKLYSNNNKRNIFEICSNSAYIELWICEKYGYEHEYKSRTYNMIKGHRCPYCAGKKVLIGFNDLAFKRPDLLVDWDYDKNEIKPNELTCGSDKRIWWKCNKCKHKWDTLLSSRTNGSGCPNCYPISYNVEKIKQLLINWNINFEIEKRFETCRDKLLLPFDFYLSDFNLLIEFNGQQHYIPSRRKDGKQKFKITQQHDKIKEEWAKSNGYDFLIIPHWEKDNIEKILFDKLQL